MTTTNNATKAGASVPRPLVDLEGIPPKDYARATEAQGNLRRFAQFAEKHSPQRIAAAFQPHEIAALRQWVETVKAWLPRFVENLPADKGGKR